MRHTSLPALLVFLLFLSASCSTRSQKGKAAKPFNIMETTIDQIHTAYKSGQLTARELVQIYLDRIEAYDQKGPAINSIITLNKKALEEADRLDAAFRQSGFVGPLHGIPIIIKDQVDAAGFPTTLGSILMKDYYPDRDAFAIGKLRKAGAIVLGKTTLGEFGGGNAFGSLFGATKNPYGLDRTPGGSSGGTGAGLAANFATVGVGEEGSASIRRPSTWNSLVGMHPSAGFVSRTGMWDGWPALHTSLGPMARTVADLARLLDVMVGYDPRRSADVAWGRACCERLHEVSRQERLEGGATWRCARIHRIRVGAWFAGLRQDYDGFRTSPRRIEGCWRSAHRSGRDSQVEGALGQTSQRPRRSGGVVQGVLQRKRRGALRVS